ncbi:MAG: hypothetical protein GX443_14570 [Deltaproteobacteria bacterium]|nr:hypothetical protein [Deltaproteobacteria bacterium]
MNEAQLGLSRSYADKIQSSNAEAAGVLLLVLDCGCIKAAPFNRHGDPVGRSALLRVIAGEKRRVCLRCRKDQGEDGARVLESTVLWLQPCLLSKRERDKILRKVLAGSAKR